MNLRKTGRRFASLRPITAYCGPFRLPPFAFVTDNSVE